MFASKPQVCNILNMYVSTSYMILWNLIFGLMIVIFIVCIQMKFIWRTKILLFLFYCHFPGNIYSSSPLSVEVFYWRLLRQSAIVSRVTFYWKQSCLSKVTLVNAQHTLLPFSFLKKTDKVFSTCFLLLFHSPIRFFPAILVSSLLGWIMNSGFQSFFFFF